MFKRTSLIFILLFCGVPVRAQISIVQHGSTENAGSATSVSFTPSSNITTNNLLVTTCAWFASGITVTVTDNASGGSNTYTDAGAGTSTNSTSGSVNSKTFTAKVVNGGGTKPAISCNFSPATLFINIAVTEMSGQDTTTPVDSTANGQPNPSANTIFNAGTLTTSAANVQVYAACVPNSHITSSGPDQIQMEFTSDDLTTEYMVKNTGAAGTYVPTFLAGTNNDNDACNVVGIKAASQTTATGVYQGNAYAQFTDTASTARSWTHTVAGGSNRLLTVSLHYRLSQGGTAPTVTFNSTTMTRTQLNCFNQSSGGTATCVDVFQQLNPATGAHTVSVTYGTSTDGIENSEDFANVNQTTPISGLQNDVSSGSGSSVTVPSSTGDWVSSRWVGVSGISALCAASSTVQDYQKKLPTNGLWNGMGHSLGASSVTMNWTTSSTTSCPGTAVGDNHAHVAFDVQSTTSTAAIPTMIPVVY